MQHLAAIVALPFILAACAAQEPPATMTPEPDPPSSARSPSATFPPLDSPTPESSPNPESLNRRVPDAMPFIVAQLLPLDGIAPIYTPKFLSADEAPLLDEELIIGIEIEGEAKAYPITVLRFREMVNDKLGGIPILVTW